MCRNSLCTALDETGIMQKKEFGLYSTQNIKHDIVPNNGTPLVKFNYW
jgi:hypothetical protein